MTSVVFLNNTAFELLLIASWQSWLDDRQCNIALLLDASAQQIHSKQTEVDKMWSSWLFGQFQVQRFCCRCHYYYITRLFSNVLEVFEIYLIFFSFWVVVIVFCKAAHWQSKKEILRAGIINYLQYSCKYLLKTKLFFAIKYRCWNCPSQAGCQQC